MPIYDLNYQTWKGERRGAIFRWMAIPKFTIMEFFGNRTFIWLFTMSWFSFLGRLFYIYLTVNTALMTLLKMSPTDLPSIKETFFFNMILWQLPFCVAFSFMLGANLISRDLAHNALVLYVSKPISRWEYFFGKFSVVFLICMLITFVQGAILFVLQTAVSGPNTPWHERFFTQYWKILPAMLIFSLIIGTTLSLMILAASSMTKNGRTAGVIFVIYLIGAVITGTTVAGMTNISNLLAISPPHVAATLGSYIFYGAANAVREQPVSPMAACLGLLWIWFLCGLIIKWRMGIAAKYGR